MVSGIVMMRSGENAMDVIGRVKQKIADITPGIAGRRQDRSRL